MSTLTASPNASEITVARETVAPSTRWPIYGAIAGVLGTVATMMTATVSEAAKAGGIEAVYGELDENRLQVQIAASLGFVTIGFLIAFGLGLRSYLAERLPTSSNVPNGILVALGGAVGSMTIAFGLKAMLAGGMPGGVDNALYTHADVAVLHLLVDQSQWLCWMGVAFVIALVAASAFKYRAVPRWIGFVSALFTVFFVGMTTILALPYSAGVVASPWLVIAGLGLIRSARRANA